MSIKEAFEARIASVISGRLVFMLGAANGLTGQKADGHKTEGFVQDLISALLAPLLPSADLLQPSLQLVDDPALGACIPDLVIRRVGGGHWGALELKTLLISDKLNASKVNRDLKKLCAYKVAYPDIAAVFVLVGSRSRLFNEQRRRAWSGLKISYEPMAFVGPRPQPQVLDTPGFVAVPCGSFNVDGVESCVFLWEVVRQSDMTLLSTGYRFVAEMA
jgi:hypothetical protein